MNTPSANQDNQPAAEDPASGEQASQAPLSEHTQAQARRAEQPEPGSTDQSESDSLVNNTGQEMDAQEGEADAASG